MIYIYDIVLNLNVYLVEFFEWEKQDNIKYIRKIPYYKVSSEFLKDLVNKKVIIENKFLEKIENKSLVEEDYGNEFKYMCLFTDSKMVIAVLFLNNGNNKYISRLLLDEEEEVLLLGNRLSLEKINYKIIDNKEDMYQTLTRKELKIKEFLKKELLNTYKQNKIDRLNYYYFEYFNEINNNKEEVFNILNNTLNTNFNEKHINLYEIIKLSYLHK